ncbi:MAG: PKD domain-containing protein, partial [Prolixibacteraceae bacterium]|nr:PKD domain-containing protein [Prolixibacteraceae bacterium]
MKLCGCSNWYKFRWIFIALSLLVLPEISLSQNLPPVLDRGIPNQHCEAGSSFSYTIPSDAFQDENGDPLTISTGSLPSWLSFDPSTRSFSGTPSSAGKSNISVSASDGSASASTSFSITAHSENTYAAFTMNYQMGCGYRLVQFTNKSKGANNYNWVLGNGNTSTSKNPSAIYNKPGKYEVTLTINEGTTDEDSHTEVINIYPRPDPEVNNITKTGCEPFDITLQSTGSPVSESAKTINDQDVGSISGGSETYYNWYFFEKHEAVITENKTNLVENFQGGIYKTILEVTDEYGCQGSKITYNHFEVYDKPEAYFTYEKSDKCSPSETKIFDQTTVLNADITQYSWTVDESPITDNNDTITYDFSTLGPGNYDISLISESEKGCVSNAYTETISFNNENTVDFNLNDYYCPGDSVSFMALTSAGAKAYSWDIGDDGEVESTNAALKYAFTSPGEYPVNLTVSFDDGCEKTIVKNVFIDGVDAQFNYNVSYNCTNESFTVHFSDQSKTLFDNDITAVEWYGTNPETRTLLSDTSEFDMVFDTAGTYHIRLDVQSNEGCISSTLQTITLEHPSLDINTSGASVGCFAGEETKFQANFDSDYENISNYEWDFGDGYTATTTTSATNHTYATGGSYDVSLTVHTNEGCTYSVLRENLIRLSDTTPVIDSVNIIQSPEKCFSEGATIDVYSANEPDVYKFITTEDIDRYDNRSGDHFAYNYFPEDTGTFNIEVVIGKFGCLSDTFSVENIEINGPKSLFSMSENTFCQDPPYEARFYNLSIEENSATEYLWQFGDGESSNTNAPTHEYTNTGDYTVKLTATDPVTGCTHTDSQTVNIYSFDDTQKIISANKTSGCVPLEVEFSQNISEKLSDNYSIEAYEWDFDNDGIIDTSTTAATITHTYEKP